MFIMLCIYSPILHANKMLLVENFVRSHLLSSPSPGYLFQSLYCTYSILVYDYELYIHYQFICLYIYSRPILFLFINNTTCMHMFIILIMRTTTSIQQFLFCTATVRGLVIRLKPFLRLGTHYRFSSGSFSDRKNWLPTLHFISIKHQETGRSSSQLVLVQSGGKPELESVFTPIYNNTRFLSKFCLSGNGSDKSC